MKKNILALIVTEKETNNIVFSEGIREPSDKVQVLLPLNLFTDKEIKDLKESKLPFNPSCLKSSSHNEIINLGEKEAFELEIELTNFKIEIKNFEINFQDLVSEENNSSNITVFVIYRNDNKELLFAEGTDSDLYDKHFLNNDFELSSLISKEDLTCDELPLNHFLDKEVEVRHITGEYKNVTLEFKKIKV